MAEATNIAVEVSGRVCDDFHHSTSLLSATQIPGRRERQHCMTTSGRSLLIHAALATARLVTRNHLAATSDRMEQCTTAPVPGIVVGHVEETTAIFRRRRKSTRRHGISQSRQS